MKEKYEKGCSVAFTGHRSIPFGKIEEVRKKVSSQLRALYAQGYRNFFCGMALGFDMLAAEELTKLKKELPEIHLIAVIPYRGQSERWGMVQRIRYNELLKEVDDSDVLSERYFNGCFLRRNDFMIDHAAALVAYFDGKPKGGTFYTVRRGKAANLKIFNLF